MVRITDCSIGSPLGFKVNDSERLDLDALVKALECYHGNKYVIGFDKSFVDTPHYHIHFHTVKAVTSNALKVFRSTLGKKFDWLTRADKFYTGQDLESADPLRWIAYAIKENVTSVTGYDLTDELKVLAKASLENKRQKKVISEKKANDEKEKKDYRAQLFNFVKENFPDTKSSGSEYYCDEYGAFCDTVIQFWINNEKFGSVKNTFLRQYYIEYKCKYSDDKWSPREIRKFIQG